MTSEPVQLVSTAGYAAIRLVFLQTIMKRGHLPLAELESMFGELEVQDPSSRDIQQLLASMNLEISSYGFEVRQISFRDETYVGFVNKEADACSAKATGYRKDGKPNGAYTSFFGALLEAMATSDTGTVSDQDAYYLPIRVAGGGGASQGDVVTQEGGESGGSRSQGREERGTLEMSLTERQRALDAFLADGWLAREGGDAFGFGPRTLLELSQVVLSMEQVTDHTRQYVNHCLGRG